jgi:hypothetical protein
MISPGNRAIVLERLSQPLFGEDGLLDILRQLREWLPSADNDTELIPLAQEVIASRKKASPKADTAKKRVKAVPTNVKPRGAETWYVIPTDPDYAVSNRLGVVRLTATKQNPAGQRLSPRLRYFRGQFHAMYRLTRMGKKMDLNVAYLLSNALRKGKKATTARKARKSVATDTLEGGI